MFSRRGIVVGGIGRAKPSHAWHSAPVDSRDLERVRRWAGEDRDALTADARAAVASALAGADNGGASAEDRLAALRWARRTARRGGTAAERSAARSIIAVLDDRRGSRVVVRRVEAPHPPTPSPEQADFSAQQPFARPRRPRASARTLRRRRAGALANLAFSVGGAGDASWTLDGRNVSARVARHGRTQTFRPGKLGDGEHRIEVKRGGGFLGASVTHAWRFTVDTTPPSIRLDGPATAKRRGALVAHGAVEPGSSVHVAGRAAAVDDGRFTVRVAPPLPKTLLLRAVDGAGNRAARRVPVEIV